LALSLPYALVTPARVSEKLHDPDLRLVDCRWYLTGPRVGRSEYEAGHLPGAVFVDVHHELAQHPGPGRHPIPDPDRFGALMRRIGVSAHTKVVAYDDAGGAAAARLWWLLRFYGHPQAALLDGGIPRWISEGRPLETSIPAFPPGDFIARPDRARVVDRDAVARRSPDTVLIDARAPERYRGDVEPIDPRAGHIPGAVNVPFAENLRDGSFRPPDELRARYAAVGADRSPVIVYCGSGVTACHDLFALELAGLSGAVLYEGSWSDWSSRPDAPIATGDEPG
jgi:thiosulfate/3-mercaptopyruvate sulfurtransferase